jgi:type 1 fimbria pilin
MTTKWLGVALTSLLLSVAAIPASRADTIQFSGAVVVPTCNTEFPSKCERHTRFETTERRLADGERDRVLNYLHEYTQTIGGRAAVRTTIYH